MPRTWLTAIAVVLAFAACRTDADEAGAVGAKVSVSSPAFDEPRPASADCPSWAELDPEALPPLPASSHTETFDLVWRTVLEKHYDPTLACLDWPALRQQYGARVAKATDHQEAYRHINAMLETLGQSHLRAVPPGEHSEAANTGNATGPALVPLTVRILGGEAVVTDPAQDGHASGLPAGSVLISVEGVSVADAIAAPLARDGREPQRRLHAARAVSSLLRCPVGGHKQVAYRDPTQADQTTHKRVECVMPSETESLGNLRDVPVRVSWKLIEGTKIGYLGFNVWMVPLLPSKIRPALVELKQGGMQALILDLRGNPGGVGAMSIPMARELTTTKLDLGRLQMRDMAQEYKPEANPDAFSGPVILLIDEGTASTSEIFAMGMHDAGRVTIVGASTSAGMALPSLMEELPDGGRLQYVVGQYTSPKGTVPEGEGVQPDVLVSEARADYSAGKDPVLEAAIQVAADQLERAK